MAQNLQDTLAQLADLITQQNRETNLVPLPSFTGTEDPIAWLDEFNKAANANNMSDERKLQVVSAYLRGIAANWFQQQTLLIENWPANWTGDDNAAFDQVFLAQFRTNAQIMSWQQQLATRIQGPTEPVNQYANDIRSLLSKIDFNNAYPEHYKIREFIKGLNSQIAFFVNKENPATLENAITIIITTETGYHQTYNNPFQLSSQKTSVQNFGIPTLAQNTFNPVLPISNTKPTQTNSNNNSEQDIISALQELTRQVKSINSRNNNYNSNRNNQSYNNYRNNNNNNNNQQRKCFTCNGFGHMARDCPNNKNNSNNNSGRNFNNNNNNQASNYNARNNFNSNNNNNYRNNNGNNRQQQNKQPANLASQNDQLLQLLQQVQSQLQSNTPTSTNNVSDNEQHLK